MERRQGSQGCGKLARDLVETGGKTAGKLWCFAGNRDFTYFIRPLELTSRHNLLSVNQLIVENLPHTPPNFGSSSPILCFPSLHREHTRGAGSEVQIARLFPLI